MLAKTMDGLLGARFHTDLDKVPMRVYREARQAGNVDTMKRAMEYSNEYSNKAEDYKKKADEGIKEDAKAAREQAAQALEQAIERRREERKKLEEQLMEKEDTSDKAERSDTEENEDGRVLLKGTEEGSHTDAGIKTEPTGMNKSNTAANKKPVLYTEHAQAGSTMSWLKFSAYV